MDGLFELYKNEGYELTEHLATDSWGDLFRARYEPHDLDVLFRRFGDEVAEPRAWDLAEAEIKAWARIDHPSVVQPLDWGNPTQGAFLATTLPDGVLLGERIRDVEAATALDPKEFVAGLAEAVEAARGYGVLHLGLDLTNVWVASPSKVCISEFGLWYLRCEFGCQSDSTAPFLAPEQRDGGKPSAATDVYAIGLLLVAVSFGMSSVALATSAPASLHWDDPSHAALVERCLLDDPLDRPRTAGDLLIATGHAMPSQEAELRDCPMCRLKRQIERDRGLRRPTLMERLRQMDDGDCQTGELRPDLNGGGLSEPRPAQGTSLASVFTWIAIAALVLAAVGVWFMAFR
jgi:serine/threonine protein kinase